MNTHPRITGMILLLILLLGGWMRWVAVEQTVVIAPLRSDAFEYFNYAFNLRHHGTYALTPWDERTAAPRPDAFRTPGYPIFLTPFVSGPPTPSMLQMVYRVQALLGTLTLFAVWILARRLLPPPAALIVTFLAAISPHLITMNHYLLTETLFAFLLLASLAAMKPDGHQGGWFLAGMLLAAAALTRPALQYFIVPAVLFLVMTGTSARKKRMALAMTVGFMLLFIPWLARNQWVLGTWSADRATIATLHHGLYPGFTFQDDPRSFGFPYRFDPRSEEISRSMDTVVTEMKRRFTREPGRHLRWFLLEKPIWLWSWGIIQGQGDAFVYPVADTPFVRHPLFQFLHRIMYATHGIWVILGAIGLIIAWIPAHRSPGTWVARLIGLVLLYMTFIHMLGAPFPRYNIPLRPLAYILALYSLVIVFHSLRDFLSNRKTNPQRPQPTVPPSAPPGTGWTNPPP
ncbi:MAG: glycosyltransferase family 39 protein [Magnetococcales bacterium]|nr:glycosyltransferase family 39 protein [Magnetococcales bacterium]